MKTRKGYNYTKVKLSKIGPFYHTGWFIHLHFKQISPLLLNTALGFGDIVVNQAQSTCFYGGYNLVGKTDVNYLIIQLINYYSGNTMGKNNNNRAPRD